MQRRVGRAGGRLTALRDLLCQHKLVPREPQLFITTASSAAGSRGAGTGRSLPREERFFKELRLAGQYERMGWVGAREALHSQQDVGPQPALPGGPVQRVGERLRVHQHGQPVRLRSIHHRGSAAPPRAFTAGPAVPASVPVRCVRRVSQKVGEGGGGGW